MENKNLVSIVIPVFNGERFIASAVESVLGQTYPMWELAIVDDGSKDGTPGICDILAAKDSRISVYHQVNCGVNSARAKGIENSHGGYIMFLDADDMLLPDSISIFMSALEPEDRIIVSGDRDCSFGQEHYIESLLTGDTGPELWGKMFDRELFAGVDFHLERRMAMGEDLLLNLMLALNVSEVKMISSKVYAPNSNNDESVTRNFKKTWDYEKYYFNRMEELFLSKCKDMSNYDEVVFLVNKSRLNGMKYVILDGNELYRHDPEYLALKEYFKTCGHKAGVSERLLFRLENARLYRAVMKTYMKFMKQAGK